MAYSIMFKYKNAVLSQGNRAMSLYISIDIRSVQAVVSCLFRLILLVAVDMAAKDRIDYNTNFIKVCHKKNLNLGQRSLVVILCGTSRYLVHEFI